MFRGGRGVIVMVCVQYIIIKPHKIIIVFDPYARYIASILWVTRKIQEEANQSCYINAQLVSTHK